MNKMEKITDLYESCTTLGGMYNNFDEAVDVTKPEEMDAVIKAGYGFKDMSGITPEMIEIFMRGKVDHINAVHDRTEEIEKKKNEERGERYGTIIKRYSDFQNREYHNADHVVPTTENHDEEYDDFHVPTWNKTENWCQPKNNIENTVDSNSKNEISDIKNEINEIKEMMKLILSKQKNNNSPVVFDN